MSKPTIVYTKTDEAPALATQSWLPIIDAFTNQAGIDLEVRDISLAARILAHFPEALEENQRVSDDLAYLGELATKAEANIIKLPNISASIPQLTAAIKELQDHGYNIPDWPAEPKNEKEEAARDTYKKVLGSAVNPVLREGNSDRRVAAAVKEYAQKHPHSMGQWSADSKSHVASMPDNDFYATEKSYISETQDAVRIEFTDKNGNSRDLREPVALQAGEIIDASFMSSAALCEFFEKQIEEAKQQDVLLSLHLKATMMKVSDPPIFGYAVTTYYRDVFEKYSDEFAQINVNPNNGIGDVYNKIVALPKDKQDEICAAIDKVYESRPKLAMVDSDKGITNLHVPSNVIIDASMPAAIRSSGKMWGADGQLHDTKAMIPDRTFADVYVETIDFCKENGAFDVTTMGNVSNVGLMAKKAQEYGSHDKTFQMEEDGVMRVISQNGDIIFEHHVEKGDIWRMNQTKDLPIKDWVKLAVTRARNTGNVTVFWLDENRPHDQNLIKKVNTYLKDHDTDGLDIHIMHPKKASRFTLEKVKDSQDVISVTGNIYRDYLTDLFPILELGTSSKMLSIVPLLAGGGLFETGAGGSAPKHVQQFIEEGHLRWDSLGEFLALSVSLEDIAQKSDNKQAAVLAHALDVANKLYLENDKSPKRKVGQTDTRVSHFYLTLYWAQALAKQDEDKTLKETFTSFAQTLSDNEQKIIDELNATQGKAQEIDGYYYADDEKIAKAMRPSKTLNEALSQLG